MFIPIVCRSTVQKLSFLNSRVPNKNANIAKNTRSSRKILKYVVTVPFELYYLFICQFPTTIEISGTVFRLQCRSQFVQFQKRTKVIFQKITRKSHCEICLIRGVHIVTFGSNTILYY